MDINAAGGRDAGIPDEKIAALPDYRTNPLFDDAERAALEMADAVTRTPADVPDELYGRLRAHFDEAQLVELASCAALENFRARFNRVFQVEPNSLYCPVPSRNDAPD